MPKKAFTILEKRWRDFAQIWSHWFRVKFCQIKCLLDFRSGSSDFCELLLERYLSMEFIFQWNQAPAKLRKQHKASVRRCLLLNLKFFDGKGARCSKNVNIPFFKTEIRICSFRMVQPSIYFSVRLRKNRKIAQTFIKNADVNSLWTLETQAK